MEFFLAFFIWNRIFRRIFLNGYFIHFLFGVVISLFLFRFLSDLCILIFALNLTGGKFIDP